MSSSETPTLRSADTQVDADVRQLITDLRDAARDGRLLADRFAEVLKRTVEEYSAPFEHRAEHLLVRLESAR
jgi:predicted nuclease with TOPRIM domain